MSLDSAIREIQAAEENRRRAEVRDRREKAIGNAEGVAIALELLGRNRAAEMVRELITVAQEMQTCLESLGKA